MHKVFKLLFLPLHHLYKYRNINNKPIHEIEIVLARSVYGFRIKKDENINSFILEKLIRLENDIKAYSIRNKNKFLQLSLEGNYE